MTKDTRYSRLDEEESKSSFDTTITEMYPPVNRKPFLRTRWFNYRNVSMVSLILLVLSILGALRHQSAEQDDGFNASGVDNPFRIAKVSMLYGDKKKNDLYERALESHIRHSEKWGYPTYVKRENEYCGYWNKPTFMISQVAQELAKPEEERMEWLMWVDADSIILNPNIPAHLFLPPKEHSNIHVVAARDIQGLNTGVFFVRVHPWTISMFVDSMAFPLCNADIDLGNDADQAAMSRTLQKNSSGLTGTGFEDGVLYVPKRFFNSYELPGYLRNGRDDVLKNFTGFTRPHAFEGQKGDFLVHLPGLFDDRAPLMTDWLDLVENRQEEWALPLEETDYVEATTEYWNTYSTAVDTLAEATKSESVSEDLTEAINELKSVLRRDADDQSRLVGCTATVKEELRKASPEYMEEMLDG